MLRDALSHGCLEGALIGAVLVTTVAVGQFLAPGSLSVTWRPLAALGSWPLADPRRIALRDAAVALVLSRVLIWVVAVGGVILLGVHPDVGAGAPVRPFGSVGRVLVAPASTWDTGAYLTIARTGYASGANVDPFFRLYPCLFRLFGLHLLRGGRNLPMRSPS